jgi:hypothetical protein
MMPYMMNSNKMFFTQRTQEPIENLLSIGEAIETYPIVEYDYNKLLINDFEIDLSKNIQLSHTPQVVPQKIHNLQLSQIDKQ